MNDKKEVIAKIKHQLQYPQLILQLIVDLPKKSFKNIPPEFFADALKAIKKINRLLEQL